MVVVIPKPKKPVIDPKSYRPISLLCVLYKIFERLTHACVKPINDPQLPRKQARFRGRKSTVNQNVLLTENIKDSFEAEKKVGAVFVKMTAPSLLIPIHTIFPPQPPESMLMSMTWLCCILLWTRRAWRKP